MEIEIIGTIIDDTLKQKKTAMLYGSFFIHIFF